VSCAGSCDQLGNADQVVGYDCEGEGRFDLGASPQLDLGEASLRFDPAEHFFDALATDLACPVARVSGGAAIQASSAHHAMFADAPVDGSECSQSPMKA
jgi:hypothetical protein